MKKWSIWLKWFGARISAPSFGTFSGRSPARGRAAASAARPAGGRRCRSSRRPCAPARGTGRSRRRAFVLVDLWLHVGHGGDARRGRPSLCVPPVCARTVTPTPRGPSPASARARGASAQQRLALVLAHPRLVARRLAPHLRDLLGAPAPGRDPGQVGGAERRRLGDLGDDHRRAEHVGLELHQPAVGDRAAVGLQLRQPLAARPPPRRARRRPSGRRSPPAPRAPGGRGRCRGSGRRSCRARRGPSTASRARSAPGRSRRRRCRRSEAASASVSAASPIDPEPVAQPLHRGAGDEDRGLERVGRPPPRAPRRPWSAAPRPARAPRRRC